MASGDTGIGTGTTLSLAAGTGTNAVTNFSAELKSIAVDGLNRAAVESSHLGTTVARTFLAGDLYDPGNIAASGHHKADEFPPVDADSGSVTITYPDFTTWLGTGFMTEASNVAPLEDVMTGDWTIKLSGAYTVTTATS